MINRIKNMKLTKRTFLNLVMVGLIVLALFGAASVGVNIWTEYRDSIIDQQKQQMYLTVRSLRDNLEVFLDEYVADSNGLYQMAEESGAAADRGSRTEDTVSRSRMLQEYVDSHSRFVYDVIAEAADGTALSTKGNRIREVYSTSRIDDNRSLLLAKLDNEEMYLVICTDEPDGGRVSMVINMEAYYETLIGDLRIGSSGYVVLKDAAGTILMHPEPAQWGIDVIEGRLKMYPNLDLDSLQQMIGHQKQGQEGVEEYYSYWWTEPGYPRVRKICAYAPVQIGTDFLIISEVMDYDDIYLPIAEGVLKLTSFALVMFAILIVMVMYMLHLTLQKQKDSEQIAYLTELNRLLEDMHRSEESIAHQQRLQIMGTMTGGIAHEFNNLLTPIMGYADLLMMELPEESDEYDNAMEIYEASAKAKEIIQQISSLSRKNMETAYKNTNGARMLTRALKMVRSICPSNVRLEENLHLDSQCLLCNETQINQVILNICVNGIHAIGHQEGVLKITADTVTRDGLQQELLMASRGGHGRYPATVPDTWRRYVHLEFADDGCGMSEEILNQIFDPFFTTKKGGKGTGLGLSLVEQIIGSHKGYVFADSKVGEGSRFHVYLPVNEQKEMMSGEDVPGAAGNAAEMGNAAGAEHEAEPGMNLLIVDDNPKVLKLLERDAARLRVGVTGCMSFEEAGAVLEQQSAAGGRPFDVLVAEQDISGTSAVEFCMSIQGRYPKLKKLVMTDRVTREVVEAKQRRTIDGHIEKPVSIALILESLKANLNNL